MERGVKQGDPLSPILFNIVHNDLLNSLPGNFKGGIEPNLSIPILAFADDKAIMADSELQIQPMLNKASSYFKTMGMHINNKNCKYLTVAITKKRTTGISALKYLGHNYSQAGMAKPNLSNLPTWLKNLQRAPLKPQQKLHILKDHRIPRLVFGLQTTKINKRILKDTDKLIRLWTKRMLHLNLHTPDQCIYARIRDGGLGITHFQTNIPKIFLNRIQNLANNMQDVTAAELTTRPEITNLLGNLHKMIESGVSTEEIRTKIK